jgi:hypothetical protein
MQDHLGVVAANKWRIAGKTLPAEAPIFDVC